MDTSSEQARSASPEFPVWFLDRLAAFPGVPTTDLEETNFEIGVLMRKTEDIRRTLYGDTGKAESDDSKLTETPNYIREMLMREGIRGPRIHDAFVQLDERMNLLIGLRETIGVLRNDKYARNIASATLLAGVVSQAVPADVLAPLSRTILGMVR